MKQRNKLLLGYVVFFAGLFIPQVCSANYSNVNGQIAALKSYSEKNLFVTNKTNDEVVNPANAFVNFLPVVKNSRTAPVLNGNIVGQALASNASLLNWNNPTADLEIEKIIVYRMASTDENGMLVPSVGSEFVLAGNSTHFIDNDIEIGVTYEYYIKAVDIEGHESDVSNVVAITTNESYDAVHNADRVLGEVTPSTATLNLEYLFADYETLYEYKVLGFYTGLFDDGGLAWENIGDYNTYFAEVNVDLNAGFLHHFVVIPVDHNGNILGTGEIITVVSPLHTPEDLQAVEVGYDFVTLQWENTNDLENMTEVVITEIYRNDQYFGYVNGNSTTFTDSTVEFGTKYTYAVKTRVGDDNSSGFSDAIEVVTLLPEVTNLQTGDIGADSIEITWENVIDDDIIEAEGIVHDIYRNGEAVGTVNGTDNSFTDSELDSLTNYKYYIVTRSNNSNSNPSSTLEVTTRPHGPRNLRATNITTDSVILEWDDPNDRADVAYLIYLDNRREGETYKPIFPNVGLSPITSYKYEVVIIVGEDNYSKPSSINVMTRPHAPQNVTATEVTSDSVTLGWENLNDLTNVTEEVVNEIYRDGNYIAEVAGNDQTFTDSDVAWGNTYTYMVITRVGNDNRSVASNVVTAKIEWGVIPPVKNLRATDVRTTEVEITWDNAIDESILETKNVFHEIYRDNKSIAIVFGEEDSFTDNNLKVLTKYKYHIVTKIFSDNVSATSDVLHVTTRPESPTNLSVTARTHYALTLNWNNINDLSNITEEVVHVIYRDDVQIAELSNDSTSFRDTGLESMSNYNYKIMTRVGGENESFPSTIEGLTRPHEPVNLRTTEVDFNFVALTWDNINDLANTDEPVVNEIYRDYQLIAEIPGEITTYTDDTVVFGSTYFYSVKTRVGIDNTSIASNQIFVEVKTISLSAVENLQATDVRDTEIEIMWDNTLDESILETVEVFHEIYRDNKQIAIVNGKDNFFKDTGLDALIEYKYHVVTCVTSSNVTSDPSVTLKVTTRPHAPTNLQVEITYMWNVLLTWENLNEFSDKAVTHVIYRDDEILDTVHGDVNSYYDTMAVLGQTYTYSVVTVVDVVNKSVNSNEVTIDYSPELPAVTNLQVTNVTVTKVELSWENHPVFSIYGVDYHIYANGEHKGSIQGKIPLGVTSAIVENLNPATRYEFYIIVELTNLNIKSEPSNIVAATTLAPLNAPNNLVETEVTESSIEIKWANNNSSPENIVNDIYRNEQLIETVNGNVYEFADIGLDSAQVYRYQVVARRGNEEATSNIISVTTRPKSPGNLSATSITESSVTINWVNNNGTSENVVNDIYRDDHLIASVGGNDNQFKDTGLKIYSRYKYEVVARVGNLTASSSNPITITTLPARPVNLKSTNVTVFSVKLSWEHNLGGIPANDVTYHIYRDNKRIGTSGTEGYTDTNVESSKTYSYHVTAVLGSTLSSLPSDPLNVTTRTKYNLYTVKVESWYKPWIGQDHRSSENMNSLQFRDNYRVTINPINNPTSLINNIKFDIKRDKKAQTDPTLFFRVGHGSMLNPQFINSNDDLYIANPSGATSSFEVIIECYNNNP